MKVTDQQIRNFLLYILLCIVSFSLTISPLWAATMEFQEGVYPTSAYTGAADTHIWEDNVDTNYGTITTFKADVQVGSGGSRWALLKWDISDIPAGSTVTGASITLQYNDTGGNFDFVEMLRDWVETEATWNEYSSGNDWGTVGAEGAGTDYTNTSLGQTVNATTGLATSTLNASGITEVQDWLDNPSTNYGLLVRGSSSDGHGNNSLNHSTKTLRPKLTVTYTEPTNITPAATSSTAQKFTVNDPVTAMATITYTEGSTASTTAANDIRIQIPSAFSMEWDQTDTTATIGGTDSSKVSTTVSYDDAQTVVIDVTTNFDANDDITISGLSFTNFTAAETADNLDFIIDGSGSAVGFTDTAEIAIGVPSISSAANQTFIVNDSTTAISTITITDDSATSTITAAEDIRITIPSGTNMVWDADDISATIGGTDSAKVSSTVSYEDSNKTMVIDVTTDFDAGDDITIADLSFETFSAASSADNLDLEVSNAGTVADTDDKTVTVESATITIASSVAQPPHIAANTTKNILGIASTSRNSGAGTVHAITVKENGTIDAASDMENIELWLSSDRIWDSGDTQIGSTNNFNDLSGTIDFTEDFSVTATPQFLIVRGDVRSGASSGDTIEIEITNASTTDDVSGTTLSIASTTSVTTYWWNTSWNFRNRIELDNLNRSSNLDNFPILVKLGSSNFDFTKAEANGEDLRFVESDNETTIDYEIESFDRDNETAIIWVEIPQLYGSANTDFIYMYYGNSTGVSSTYDAAATWNSGYEAVWHFASTSGNYLDSTSNDHDSNEIAVVSRASTTPTGGFANFPDFDGGAGTDFVAFPDSDGWDSTTWTLEAFINPAGNGTTVSNGGDGLSDGYPIVTKGMGEAENNAADVQFYMGLRQTIYQIGGDFENDNTIEGNSQGNPITGTSTALSVSGGTWYHTVVTMDNTNDHMYVYVDGSEAGETSPNTTPSTGGGQRVMISASAKNGDASETGGFNGAIDEVRISTVQRSADYLSATADSLHNTMNTIASSSGFLTSTNIEPASLVAGAVGNVTVSFVTANTIPADGKIIIEFPKTLGSGFTLNSGGTTDTSSLSGIDGSISESVSSSTITLTRSGGSASATGTKSFTLSNVKNPNFQGSAGTYDIKIVDANGVLIDQDKAVTADTITKGSLSSTNVEPESLAAGSVGTTTVSFTTANPIPPDGKIVITFPSSLGTGFQFDSGSDTHAVVGTNLDGLLTVATSTNTITLTRSGSAATSSAGATTLTLGNIVTPGTSGSTGTYSIEIKENDDTVIDDDTSVTADTVTAGALASTNIEPADLEESTVGNVTVTFTTINPIPPDGKILVNLPTSLGSGFVYDSGGTTAVSSITGLDGTLSLSTSGATTTLTRGGGAATSTAGIKSFVLSQIKNPNTAGSTGVYAIVTTNGSDAIIDQDYSVTADTVTATPAEDSGSSDSSSSSAGGGNVVGNIGGLAGGNIVAPQIQDQSAIIAQIEQGDVPAVPAEVTDPAQDSAAIVDVGPTIEEVARRAQGLIEAVVPGNRITIDRDNFVERVVIEPIPAEELPVVPPIVFSGELDVVPREQLEKFVFKPLPNELVAVIKKFPELESTLEATGVEQTSDISRLVGVKFNLPKIGELTAPSGDIDLGNLPNVPSLGGELDTQGFASGSNIPVADLPQSAIAQIPESVVFLRTPDESIDLNIKLSLNERGEVRQTLNVLQGQSVKLFIKPDKEVAKVHGRLLLFPEKVFGLEKESVPLGALSASLVFSNPKLTQKVNPVNRRLVVDEFEYIDRNGDGIYEADLTMPILVGQYNIVTIVEPLDQSEEPEQIELITVIDPEGYVYEDLGNNELRINGATVTIYEHLSDENVVIWPAEDFQQDNPQVTDRSGRYAFLVPEGIYHLEAVARGYRDYRSEDFIVTKGDGIHINIELKKKGFFARIFGWLWRK